MNTRHPSGRFVLRIDPALHAELRTASANAGLSLNEYCARKLAGAAGEPAFPPGLDTVVQRAKGMLGDQLAGVVAYGSWARGEAVDGSDVDILLALQPGTSIRRELYREWDAQPLEWDGREVEVSFAALPKVGEVVAGLWGEVALDGVVLFDRDWKVSGRLIQTRHDIVAGRIVRRVSHGQPYWVENESEPIHS